MEREMFARLCYLCFAFNFAIVSVLSTSWDGKTPWFTGTCKTHSYISRAFRFRQVLLQVKRLLVLSKLEKNNKLVNR